MNKDLRKVLKEPCKAISVLTGIDEYSKHMDLLEHTLLLAQCAIDHEDITDVSLDNGVSKSQISKLDNSRSYQAFAGIFYELLNHEMRAHNLSSYGRFLRILGMDSTFIRTSIREAGKYRRTRTDEGIKVHMPAILFPATIPLDPMITSANLNDSPVMDKILESLEDAYGESFLKSSITVFDLGYYDLERFIILKMKGYPFVTRIKKNAVFDVMKEYAHSRIIRFRNGLELRLVTLIVHGEERNYLTDILDLPDQYIHWIYSRRWEIEIFFRRMKSLLKLDHLIARKINGIMVQIFAFLVAYLALLIMQAMLPGYSMAEIIRMIRHGIPLPIRERGGNAHIDGSE